MPAEPPSATAPSLRRSPRLLRWYDARRGSRAVVLGWLVTRLLVLVLLATAERVVVGDVSYYHRRIADLAQVGLPGTLEEYPTPVVWLLTVPYGLTGGGPTGYLLGFVALMLLIDAGFTYALWRAAGRRHDRAIDVWLAYVFLIGPLCYVRFDIVPAVLAGGAMLALRRRPWLAGALTGLGAAIKLWPALLIGAFAARRRGRPAALGAFVLVGFGLAALSLATGGSARLFSPLTWQSGRGLQIESVWATPLMVARLADPTRWHVDFSTFKAFEIFGPGVAGWLHVSTAATGVGLLVIAALLVRAFLAEGPSPYAVGLLVLATVAIMTITNKTLSPQYLLWMGGPAAGLVLLAPNLTPRQRTVIGRLTVQLLALALLTHLVYPLFYDGLIGIAGPTMMALGTLVTTLRNLALVLFTVEVCRYAWTSLRPPGRPARR